jgi:hypothetical protein
MTVPNSTGRDKATRRQSAPVPREIKSSEFVVESDDEADGNERDASLAGSVGGEVAISVSDNDREDDRATPSVVSDAEVPTIADAKLSPEDFAARCKQGGSGRSKGDLGGKKKKGKKARFGVSS